VRKKGKRKHQNANIPTLRVERQKEHSLAILSSRFKEWSGD